MDATAYMAPVRGLSCFLISMYLTLKDCLNLFLFCSVFFDVCLIYDEHSVYFQSPVEIYQTRMFRPVCLQVLVSCRLSRHILWMGIANFILCPLIFLWQILYSFFRYAEVCYLSVLGNITEMILVICMLEFMYLHKHTCSILFFLLRVTAMPQWFS